MTNIIERKIETLKKVLYINCSDSGSTGKIIKDTADFIYDCDWMSVLCAPRIKQKPGSRLKLYETSLRYEQGIYCRISYFTGDIYGFEPLSTHKILSIISKEKPDVVHIHCINGFTVNVYKLLGHLRNNSIPTVVTNHAEFFYTGFCNHANNCEKWKTGCGECPQVTKHYGILVDKTAKQWHRMKNAFGGFTKMCVTSVSPWVYSRSVLSPILEGVQQVVIENGINTDIFRPSTDSSALRAELGIKPEEKVIFHTTASFSEAKDQKGGAYLLELAKRCKSENVRFVVAGPYSRSLVSPENMLLLGMVTDQNKLAALYSLADLSVITSERETFSLPVAESLCCGTPVVGFFAGGPESIAIKHYTEFCPFGDIDLLQTIILKKWLLFKSKSEDNVISTIAREKYSSKLISQKYLELYEKLIKMKGKNNESKNQY